MRFLNILVPLLTLIASTDAVKVELDLDKPLAEVSPEYVSFNIDACAWRRTDLKSKMLDVLTSAFTSTGPTHLRVGGTQQDYDIYQFGDFQGLTCKDLPSPMTDFRCRLVTEDQWSGLIDFAKRNKLTLIYGLNDMFGRPTKTLHPEDPLCDGPGGCPLRNHSNLEALLRWTAEHRPDAPFYAFELGNELNAVLNGEKGAKTQVADFEALAKLRDELWESGKRPKLIGPDSHSWTELSEKPNALPWWQAFTSAAADTVDGFTFHMYSMGSGQKLDANQLSESFLNATALDRSREGAKKLVDIVSAHAKGKPVWGGETASATDGHTNITDTFINGFWYLDQLGSHAALGVHVFQRQVLIGGGYPMIDPDSIEPLPDYWAALLHKKLMGKKVLKMSSSTTNLRTYAHCATSTGVVVLLLNLDKEAVTVEFDGKLGNRLEKYVMQAGSKIDGAPNALQSRQVLLNGVALQVQPGPALPDLAGKSSTGKSMAMPATSYAFVHFPDAAAAACTAASADLLMV